jgi:hypothetical protein
VDSLTEGLAKFVLGGLASGSSGRRSGGCGILDLVGGTCHGGSLEYYVAKEGGQFMWSSLWGVRLDKDEEGTFLGRYDCNLIKARKENFLEDTIAAGQEPCVKGWKAIILVK